VTDIALMTPYQLDACWEYAVAPQMKQKKAGR